MHHIQSSLHGTAGSTQLSLQSSARSTDQGGFKLLFSRATFDTTLKLPKDSVFSNWHGAATLSEAFASQFETTMSRIAAIPPEQITAYLQKYLSYVMFRFCREDHLQVLHDRSFRVILWKPENGLLNVKEDWISLDCFKTATISPGNMQYPEYVNQWSLAPSSVQQLSPRNRGYLITSPASATHHGLTTQLRSTQVIDQRRTQSFSASYLRGRRLIFKGSLCQPIAGLISHDFFSILLHDLLYYRISWICQQEFSIQILRK